ncbi:MAG: hypothetical protein Q9220_005562 [cf. Caloplaca sp. 1 TL-2023]
MPRGKMKGEGVPYNNTTGRTEYLNPLTQSLAAIISADHFSRAYEKSQHPEENFQDSASLARAQKLANQSAYERFMTFGKEQRYKIVGVSWVASMGVALTIVGRSPYLSTAQKLVQARVYAQGLTVAVLVATAVFEIGDRGKDEEDDGSRWEAMEEKDKEGKKKVVEKKVHQERYAGEDQWKDMVEAEEQKEKARMDAIHEQEERDRREGKIHHKKKVHHTQKNGKEEGKDEEKKGGGGKADGKKG